MPDKRLECLKITTKEVKGACLPVCPLVLMVSLWHVDRTPARMPMVYKITEELVSVLDLGHSKVVDLARLSSI